jgi:hypothetical protein
MTEDDPRVRLLADMLKLLKKHGEHSFHSLAEALRTPELADTLTTILRETPKRAPTKKQPKKPPAKTKSQKPPDAPTTSLQQWSDIILTEPQPRTKKA